VLALSSGYSHTCALKSDNTLACWGFNNGGQLGDGTTTKSTLPLAVASVNAVAAVATGASHTCALKTDGSAACWGSNSAGQLGDGTMTNRPAPTAVLAGSVYWK
jgi:alpha-tubulin suppressor-like RCC1 family protein